MDYEVTSHAPSFSAKIYISGSLDIIKQICRKYCKENPLCVNISETSFIYCGGEEMGACVELINYPKYPKSEKDILAKAKELASMIKKETYQDSILLVAGDTTYWWSDRETKYSLDEIINNAF